MNKIFVCFSHFYSIHLRYKINGTVKIQREPDHTVDDGSLPQQVTQFVFNLLFFYKHALKEQNFYAED